VKSGLAALGIAAFAAGAGGVSLAQSQSAAKPAGDPAALDKGRDIFTNYGCASCHSLDDAGAIGHAGPALDENSGLSHDLIVDRVTNGQGMMPPFAGQLSKDEIDTVANYIMKVAKPAK
jgi:mono/diheme cytochrome c family protein